MKDETIKQDSDAELGDESPIKEDAKIEAVRSASFISCVVNMGMTAMGLGVLGLGASFTQMGFVLAIILTIVAGAFTHVSMTFLANVCTRTGTFSFEELSGHYLGWWGVRFTNWALILQLFFVVKAFVIIPQGSLATLQYPDVAKQASSPDTLTFRRLLGFGIVIYVAAVGTIRSLSKLSFFSSVAFILLSLAVLFFSIDLFSLTEFASPSLWPSAGSDAVAGIGNMVLAYTSQFNLVTCHSEMKDRSRIYTLIHITVFGMCIPLYCFMGITGMFLNDPKSNIFDSLPTSNLATAGKIMVSLMGILKTPLIFNAMRDYIFREARLVPMLQFTDVENISHRAVASIIFALLAYFATFLYTNIGPPVGLSGSLFMAPVNYILPGLYVMKDINMFADENKRVSFFWNSGVTRRSKFIYVLALSLVIFGIFCSVAGVIDVAFQLS